MVKMLAPQWDCGRGIIFLCCCRHDYFLPVGNFSFNITKFAVENLPLWGSLGGKFNF